MVRGLIVVTNQCNKDIAAKYKVIKCLIEQTNIDINVKRVNSHKKITESFQ